MEVFTTSALEDPRESLPQGLDLSTRDEALFHDQEPVPAECRHLVVSQALVGQRVVSVTRHPDQATRSAWRSSEAPGAG